MIVWSAMTCLFNALRKPLGIHQVVTIETPIHSESSLVVWPLSGNVSSPMCSALVMRRLLRFERDGAVPVGRRGAGVLGDEEGEEVLGLVVGRDSVKVF